jgi:hypothetical protein
MKKKLTSLLLVSLITFATVKVQAQALDMALVSAIIGPSPASYPGKVTIGFQILAELFDQPLSSDDMGISHARITLSLSNLQGSSSIMPTGAGADMFDWIFIAEHNTYIGSSKDVVMPHDIFHQVTFTDLPVIAPSTITNTGFQVNLMPPGDLLDSQSNDDGPNIFTSAPLPVTLVSFKAEKEGNLAQLTWSTTEETNSDRFEVERSATGKDWQKIGEVSSHGESTVLRQYTYTDRTPLDGANLYRLKMVDLDDTFTYSSLRIVQFEENTADDLVFVYPNPTTDKVYLNKMDLTTVKQVSVVDMKGRSMLVATSAVNGIDVKNLSAGAYLLKVSNSDGSTNTHKFLINR